MRRLLTFVFLTLAVLAARRYMAMRPALAALPQGFRHPLLPFLKVGAGPRTLPISRFCMRFPARPGPGVTVSKQIVFGDTPVRALILAPSGSAPTLLNRPAVLYLHGGGLVTGSPQFEANASGRLARELGAVVVAPDYRLAPEHPFPAALDDCMAVLCWMRERSGALGIDPDRIAVAGASAGAGLAAAVAQRSYDEGVPLRAQVLVYPMLDDRTTLRDAVAGRGQFLWTARENLFGWAAYLGRSPRLSDAPPYAAAARRTQLAGLPPAWIGVGDRDLFHDEAVDYAQRLSMSGVATELTVVPGMYHGADGIVGKHPAMQSFRCSYTQYLRKYL
ncbi:alpha/beta hydrolase [Mycobacterium colombiense]